MKFTWRYKGKTYTSRVESKCMMCGAGAVVKLPRGIAQEQHDGTTHVCHPSVGGCNHGFTRDVLDPALTEQTS